MVLKNGFCHGQILMTLPVCIEVGIYYIKFFPIGIWGVSNKINPRTWKNSSSCIVAIIHGRQIFFRGGGVKLVDPIFYRHFFQKKKIIFFFKKIKNKNKFVFFWKKMKKIRQYYVKFVFCYPKFNFFLKIKKKIVFFLTKLKKNRQYQVKFCILLPMCPIMI
jgi:hypothetical protein